jgi:putative DNA primase/helicase
MTAADYAGQFRDAIAQAGLTPPDAIHDDGELHRFASNGKRSDDAGWYVFHGDGIPAGSFGDWRSGISQTWRADIGRKLSPFEAAELSRPAAAAKANREADEARRHAEARESAAATWRAALPARADHPYLTAKRIEAHGIRQDGDDLVIPMRAASGELHSLQTIAPDGTKHFAKDGRVTGCYFAVGEPDGAICIAEGFATAASIHEATGKAVAVAFNAGNLAAVARELHAKLRPVRIILCADDDYRTDGNPGIREATKAARAVGGLLAIPDFGDNRPHGATDFNDLARHAGADAIKRALANAAAPEASSHQGATPSAPAAEEWPEPQPLIADGTLPPYPMAALPVGIGAAVAEVVAFVQSPPDLAACSALSALSLAAQGLANVQRDEGLTGPISLYLLAIADSGERKTTCDRHFLDTLRDWEAEQAERMLPDVAKNRAALASWEQRRDGIKARIKDAAKRSEPTANDETELAQVEADRPALLRVPRLIHGDTTPEALAWNLANGWPSGGVMSSEAGIVFGGHGMQSDAVMRNLSLLNALWDGVAHRVDRRQSDSFLLIGARLTMGLAAQPETVRQFLEKTKGLARGNGFAARFLIAAPASTQGTRLYRPPGSRNATAAFVARLRALLDMPTPTDDRGALMPPTLTLNAPAFEVWRAFHDDTEREQRAGGDMAQVRDVASKAADNASRLAALFHLYQHGVTGRIGADSMQAAATVVGWHLYQARAFFDDVAAPREVSNARRLDAWLIDRCRFEGIAEITRREVQNGGPNPVRKGIELDNALRELIEAGRVRLIERGRKELIAVNPALLKGPA